MKRTKFDIDKFFANGKEATEFNKITLKLSKKASKELIDEKRVKRDRAWGVLANRIVGAERF